jgi:hypothetical protein
MIIFRRRFRVLSRFAWIGIAVMLTVVCGDGDPQRPGDKGGNNGTGSGVDTIPPATISGLVVKSPKVSSVSLVWIAPGDDGTAGQAAGYDIRYSLSTINDQNWDTAMPVDGIHVPKPAGQIETIAVAGLPSESAVHFALKTYDEVPNESGLSNCAMDTTKDMGPTSISDLKAKAISETEFLLTWTATGDDGMNGTASYYDIRYSKSAINEGNWDGAAMATGEPAPKASGEPDSFMVTGLDPQTNYYFMMKIADEVPNWSLVSNVFPAFAYGVNLWATPQNLYEGDELFISYRSSPSEVTYVNIWGSVYTWPPGWQNKIVKHLVGDQLPDDVYMATWDLTDDEGIPIETTWGEQYIVKLHWGDSLVDSVLVRFFPD